LPDEQYIRSYVISVSHGSSCGLHEIPEAIAARLSGHSQAEILAVCQSVCAELLERQHVSMHVTPAFGERPMRGSYVAVSPDEALLVVRRAESWQSPSNSQPRYWLTTTDAGEAAYYSDETVSL
jgi:hypothetical protein